MARVLFTKLFTYYLLDWRKGFIIVYERVARFHQWYRSINLGREPSRELGGL